MCVFPGGRLDPKTTPSRASVGTGQRPVDRPPAVAAIRECLRSESGWARAPREHLRNRLLDTRAGIVAEDQVVPDLSLAPLGMVDHARGGRRRHDTRFHHPAHPRTVRPRHPRYTRDRRPAGSPPRCHRGRSTGHALRRTAHLAHAPGFAAFDTGRNWPIRSRGRYHR